jgi:cell division protein ZapA
MAQVSVTINGRVYRMSCDDGHEEHLMRLARDLDSRIGQMRETFGEIGDTRLAVIAALMISDELSEARRNLRAAEQEIEGLHQEHLSAAGQVEDAERAYAEAIEAAALRIERIAHGLNGGMTESSAHG